MYFRGQPGGAGESGGLHSGPTEEQVRGGVSLDAQEERVRAYCTMSGMELVSVIREEGVSGAKPLDGRIAERTAAALGPKKAHLQVYSPTPFGYDRDGAALVVNRAKWQTQEPMRAWRTGGRTLRQIADELTQRATPTKNGGRRWYAFTVRHILRNDLYERAA